MEGSLGSKMRSEWLAAEFAQVDEDGYGIVSEDVAVATICKLCPGFKEAKVRKMKNHWQIISHFYDRHSVKHNSDDMVQSCWSKGQLYCYYSITILLYKLFLLGLVPSFESLEKYCFC